MNNTDTYKHFYQALGLKDDCSWKELRKQYKKSIQKWHPDRFMEGSIEKHIAEDKIKIINIAFNQLNKYYKESGHLPKTETKPAETKTEKTGSPKKTTPPPSTATHKNSKKIKKYRTIDKRPRFTKRTGIAVLATLTGSYYLFSDSSYEHLPEENNFETALSSTKRPDTIIKNSHEKRKEKKRKSSIARPINSSYFTIGSSISDVISIQGTPTKTEGNTWFYGKSEVHFNEGRVISWSRKNDTILHASLRHRSIKH